MIASALDFVPCGNSVPVLKTDCSKTALELVACLNSFVFDFALRCRMSGNNLNYFLVGEMPLPPKLIVANHPEIAEMAAALNLNQRRFSSIWRRLIEPSAQSNHGFQPIWISCSSHRRQVRALLDASLAHIFGLSYDDLHWILRDCIVGETRATAKSCNVACSKKGFWRAEQEIAEADKHATVCLEMFKRLINVGWERFISETWRNGSLLSLATDERHQCNDSHGVVCRKLIMHELKIHDRRLKQLKDFFVASRNRFE